jgi:hypothetical protein
VLREICLNCPKLEYLRIDYIYRDTWYEIRYISNLKNLKCLTLGDSYYCRDHGEEFMHEIEEEYGMFDHISEINLLCSKGSSIILRELTMRIPSALRLIRFFDNEVKMIRIIDGMWYCDNIQV